MDISVELIDHVAVIRWNDGENRINLDSLARLREIFTDLAATDGPLSVVWTGTGKFFSNGLDLARFAENPDEFGETTHQLDQLFGQILVFPGYTITAINGHAFAGGAMLSLTTDYRAMRSDRGYWCLNEVDINMFLPPNMASLVLARLPQATALDAMNTARRYSAADALHYGIVDTIAPDETLMPQVLEYAASIAVKNRQGIAAHKAFVFGDLAERLRA